MNRVDPEGSRDIRKSRTVVQISNLGGADLRHIQRQAENILVGLAQVDEARRDETIREAVELEPANPVRVQLAAFIVYDENLERMARLEIAHQLDHLRIRLGLAPHETLKFFPRESPLLVKHDAVQILIQGQLPGLIGVEIEVMQVV